MEEQKYFVKLQDLVEKMKLNNLTPEVDISDTRIYVSDLNRPALQLAGFFDYFDADRLQIIGKVEYAYIQNIFSPERKAVFEKLLSYHIPGIVFSRELEPMVEFIELAKKFNVPIFQTNMPTSYFSSEVNRYLKTQLAPRVSLHGVLVDVYGEGVFITGESGIGKSETALELIKRGHRLVADDVVEIRKVSEETLFGRAPEIIRHLIEVRGVGIVDCKTLFGVESVKETQTINLVIQLEDWQPGKEYDRLGLNEEYMNILGNDIVCHRIPIRPGRNLSIIVEAAAINHRQKAMGYNAAVELNNRVTANLEKKAKEREDQERIRAKEAERIEREKQSYV